MKKRSVLLLIASLSLVVVANSIVSPTSAQTTLRVLVVGDHINDNILTRIQLDPSFQIFISEDVGIDISSYDSILILDYAPNTEEINLLSLFTGGRICFGKV